MKLETCEGKRTGETREQGQSRRAKESRKRTLEFARKFREDDERRKASALKVVEAALPNYEEVPL